MITQRRIAGIVLPSALLLALSGCALLDASGAEESLTGLEVCALGHTWTLDLEDLATQVRTELEKNKVPVTDVVGSGSQTLEWTTESGMTVTSDYTVTVTTAPAADQVLTVTQTHRGSSAGKVYINAEVAIPRQWDGTGFNVDTTGDLNGEPVEDLTLVIPATDFDDAVGIELTCDGDELTTHPRGSTITQKWTKSD